MVAASTLPVTAGVGLARRLAVSAASQLFARSVHLVLNVATSVLIVRYLGQGGYGDYAKVVIVVGWTSLVGELGLPKVALRIAAEESARVGDVIATVTVLRLLFSVVAAGVTQLALTAVHPSAAVRVAAAVACLAFVVEAFLSCVIAFQVRLQQQYEGLVRVAMEVVELAALVAVMAAGGGIVALVGAPIVAGSFGVVVARRIAKRLSHDRASFDADLARRLLRLTVPVVPGTLLGVLILKFDGMMVAALGTRADAGAYVAAFQPVEYVLLALGMVVAYPFLPVLVTTYRADPPAFRSTYSRATEFLIAITLPVAVVAAVVGFPLVHMVYGDGWSASVRPLQILSCALVFMAISGWHGFVLLAGDHQLDSLRYGALALAVSLVACIALIGRLGPAGGAWAALVANLAGTVYSTKLLRLRMSARFPYRGAARIVAANAALMAALVCLRQAGLAWPLLIAVVVPLYATSLWALGALTPSNVRQMLGRPNAVIRAAS
jgi:O-antigen/teichoic acid export membrane protein